VEKREHLKQSTSFLDRVTDDFRKAVTETSKETSLAAIKTGTGRYKSVNEKNLDSKGGYKGTDSKPTKLQ
jgi:hypothetical protein